MFTPFTKEDRVLDQKPFLDDEVQYNLFHRIIEGKEYLALKTADHNLIALQNPGYFMWLWVNQDLNSKKVAGLMNDLSFKLQKHKLPGVSGRPEVARLFAEKYAKLQGVSYENGMPMESYHCPKVTMPTGVSGELISPRLRDHLDIVSEYLAGFIYWGYDKKVSKESQLPAAKRLLQSDNLYLWQVKGQIVSMACIAHRTSRHARVNSVYTPPEERKQGYASALVANLSLKILDQGLTPVLFTDLRNPTSNKVYKNIGYKECGKIDEIKFDY